MNNVISTRATIFRNIKDFKFENKLTNENKQEIVNILQNALGNKMSYLNIKQADGAVSSHLLGNDLILGNTQDMFVSKDNTVINLFNEEHISIVSTCVGFEKDVIKRVIDVSNHLSNKVSFAFSDEYGYLMSDLNKIGAGVKLESNIMLSAITKINKIEQVKRNVAKLGYSLMETKYPAVYTLATRCSLGISEKKICEDFENTLIKLQELEFESVKMLDIENHDDMMDKVARSIAILNSAVLLSYDELYNIIVNLRMGLNLGLTNVKYETLNKLQHLISSKNNDLVTQTELKELANKAKEIIKGE